MFFSLQLIYIKVSFNIREEVVMVFCWVTQCSPLPLPNREVKSFKPMVLHHNAGALRKAQDKIRYLTFLLKKPSDLFLERIFYYLPLLSAK